jgi:hypothetical protein
MSTQFDLFAELEPVETPAAVAKPFEDLTYLTIRPTDTTREEWARNTLRRYLEWLLITINRRGMYAESCKANIRGILQRMGGIGGTW